MPRIDRYIFKLMLTLFGFFALVLISVYWVNRAVSLFERLISDGQTALVVLEFTILTLPMVISVVLPVAAFAASAYATNRLSGESEMVAMQAAGMSPWRLARPVVMFGVIVAIMVAILVHALVPMARERMAIRQAEISENVTAQFLRSGVFQYPADGITLFIRSITPSGELLGLLFEDARNPDNPRTYSAERAMLVKSETGPKLIMVSGMVQDLRRDTARPRLSVTRFADLTYDLGTILSPDAETGRDLRDYSTARLITPDAELLRATGATPARARLEAHERLAQPLLSPIAALLGFATLLIGGFSRFGVWRQVGWAIVGLIALQFLSNAAANLATKTPALWPVLYSPFVTGTLMCCFLLWLAARARRPRSVT